LAHWGNLWCSYHVICWIEKVPELMHCSVSLSLVLFLQTNRCMLLRFTITYRSVYSPTCD
jgi:hypothetical protein